MRFLKKHSAFYCAFQNVQDFLPIQSFLLNFDVFIVFSLTLELFSAILIFYLIILRSFYFLFLDPAAEVYLVVLMPLTGRRSREGI